MGKCETLRGHNIFIHTKDPFGYSHLFSISGDDNKKEEKEKPNLGLSGALTEDTNTFRGVVIKYNEPPEARKPKKRWRLYPFKGTEALKVELLFELIL